MNKNSITINMTEKKIYSGHLKLGGKNPEGDKISFTNYYVELNSEPFFGICGEFHFSRCPYSCWEEEILKIKAAGINIISTYIFWNHHEEQKGKFTWDKDKNLRHFIDICSKHGMYVILRIGPFSHGEVRNGGLPDWLYGRPFVVRSNDEQYLAYVKRLFSEIGKQAAGQMYKDGGPVIGVQLENEHMHASAPWEFMNMKECEWIDSGRDGTEHIKILKKLAIEAGMEAPIYTCTAWGGASFIEDETFPMYSCYAFCPWFISQDNINHGPTTEYIIQNFHDYNYKCINFNPPYNPEKYPYGCCELGGGMACWYNYRFTVPPESVEAATIVKIAGGCNFIGYYMFRDGTNPVGKYGYMNERVVPKISYNFQAPIGEYGQIRDSYRYLKAIFYFLKECEKELCTMGTVLPEGAEKVNPEDNNTLRYALRQKDGSGFIFLTNYQDHFKMKDHRNIFMEINTVKEKIAFPKKKGFTLKKNVSAILPFNMDMGEIVLKYSTTQLVTSITESEASTYFFFTPDGIDGEYCFDASYLENIEAVSGTVERDGNFAYVYVKQGKQCIATLSTNSKKKIRICTLTRMEALGLWKSKLWGRERVIISNAHIYEKNGALEVRSMNNPNIYLSIFPFAKSELSTSSGIFMGRREGIFTSFDICLPEKNIQIDFKKAGQDKAVVNVPSNAFDGVNEIYLQIDYLGSVGNAFIDGTLVSDDFCNGDIWEIGLRRFYPEVLRKGIYFHIVPYIKGSDVIFDGDIKFRHDFSGGKTAEIFSINAVPEYNVTINCTTAA